MTLIDSHCHLNFSAFKKNYQEIIADCLKKGIGLIIVGSQYETSRRAVVMANEYPNEPVYASIGLHPIHLSHTEVDEEEIKFISREEKFEAEKHQKLVDDDKSHKIVAVGECGLDYWHEPEIIKTLKHENIKTKDKKEKWKQKSAINSQQLTINKKENWQERQKRGFIEQLNFAKKNHLPVILHARGSKGNSDDVYEDMLKILSSRDKACLVSTGQQRGVIHCFSSTLEIAQEFLDLGFYLGFTGIITFKNKSVLSLQEVVKFVPLDRILVETDAPYLAPEPHRGEKNLPQYVEFVARQIATLKGVSYEEVCRVTTENARKLFLCQPPTPIGKKSP